MASVTDSKYEEGSTFMLNPKDANQNNLQQFKNSKIGIDISKDIFTKTTKNYKPEQINEVFELGKPDKSILFFVRKKLVVIKGSKSSIHSMFLKPGGGKGDTTKLTEIKETMSLIVLRSLIENGKIISEDEATNEMAKMIGKDSLKLYSTQNYLSGIAQAKEFKKQNIAKGSGYVYERQKESFTKRLYKIGTSLSKKAPDNWNPSDIWMMKKSPKNKDMMKMIENAQHYQEIATLLNRFLDDGDLIGISLKQSPGNPSFELIDPQKLIKEKVPLDFKFVNMTFPGVSSQKPFNNATIETKDGFQLRIGHKGTGFVSGIIEGKMKSAGHQIGQPDAKEHADIMKRKYNYELRTGSAVNQGLVERAKDDAKVLLNKAPFTSTQQKDINSYLGIIDKDNSLKRLHFMHLITYLYGIFVATKNDYNNYMRFVYNLSRKVSERSTVYCLLKG